MDKKRIKILTSGVIKIKGFINGPVLTPYYEDINTIFALVSGGVKVVEVCDDGEEILLNTSNFSNDNSKAARDAAKAKEEAEQRAKAEKEKKIKEAEEAKAKKEAEEARAKAEAEERARQIAEEKKNVTDEVTYNKTQYNNNNNYKKDKHNHQQKGYNKQPETVKVEDVKPEEINLNK